MIRNVTKCVAVDDIRPKSSNGCSTPDKRILVVETLMTWTSSREVEKR